MADHSAHHWIAGAIQHPGALRREAKAAGKSLSAFEAEHHDNPRIERQVALAKTLKKMHHKGM